MTKLQNSCSGFTLLELIQSSFLIGVILAFGAPNLQYMIQQTAYKASLRETYQFISAAKADAATRNTNVVICTLNNGECNGLGSQWTAFTDNNNDKKKQATETSLRRLDLKLQINAWRKDNKPIRFLPDGQARGNNGTLALCSKHGSGNQIVISNTGRIRVAANEHCAKYPLS